MEKTLTNLLQAYLGECQARNRYTYYASVAKKQGFEQIAEIFSLTAEQEKVHAKRIFEHLQELKKSLGREAEAFSVTVPAPTDYGDTATNLQAAINGENHEHTSMYPDFATQADADGLPKIAARLRAIAKAEEHHEERFQKLLTNLAHETVFKKDTKVMWICRECGYAHFGEVPPEMCPSCDHPRAYYQLKSEDY